MFGICSSENDSIITLNSWVQYEQNVYVYIYKYL